MLTVAIVVTPEAAGDPPPMSKPTKLTLNVDAADVAFIETLLDEYRPFLRAHAVGVAALHLGLDALRREPTMLRAVIAEIRAGEARR